MKCDYYIAQIVNESNCFVAVVVFFCGGGVWLKKNKEVMRRNVYLKYCTP